ncbi:MAG: transposase [Holosporales bacterium]|nr:transposase [Holosporales bacterium]
MVLFLPAYSPDLNPIEQFWSWLKRKLREILHNYTSLDEAIQTSFQLI